MIFAEQQQCCAAPCAILCEDKAFIILLSWGVPQAQCARSRVSHKNGSKILVGGVWLYALSVYRRLYIDCYELLLPVLFVESAPARYLYCSSLHCHRPRFFLASCGPCLSRFSGKCAQCHNLNAWAGGYNHRHWLSAQPHVGLDHRRGPQEGDARGPGHNSREVHRYADRRSAHLPFRTDSATDC